ncbi:MAG: DUF177 domain-containing protein [Bacteroidetes bacterium]|nr:DUF177 domain-containing protein [Bacteroidota bacterium]
MAPLRIFDIPFIGLADGDHSYDYTLNGAFFEEFGNEELKESSFKVDVVLSKKPTFMELTMHFSGSCTVPCDRCDAPLEILMDGDSFLVVRFGEGPDQDEELMYIPNNATQVNIAQSLFETIAIMLPARRKHKKKDCDPKAIEALEQLSRSSEEESDPRWDALKILKTKEDK